MGHFPVSATDSEYHDTQSLLLMPRGRERIKTWPGFGSSGDKHTKQGNSQAVCGYLQTELFHNCTKHDNKPEREGGLDLV